MLLLAVLVPVLAAGACAPAPVAREVELAEAAVTSGVIPADAKVYQWITEMETGSDTPLVLACTALILEREHYSYYSASAGIGVGLSCVSIDTPPASPAQGTTKGGGS
jgi:hypothetical protein